MIVQASPTLFLLLMKLDGPLAYSAADLRAEYVARAADIQAHSFSNAQTIPNPVNDRTKPKNINL